MRCSFLLLIAFASIVRPADLQAEASGGRTEAGGAFMSSCRAWPSMGFVSGQSLCHSPRDLPAPEVASALMGRYGRIMVGHCAPGGFSMRKKAGRVIAVGAMITILGLGGGLVAFASLALAQSQRAPRHERRPVPYSEHSQYEPVARLPALVSRGYLALRSAIIQDRR